MAFEPGGGFFFTERTGNINYGTVAGQRTVLGRPGDVVAQGEGGMMGIAVDPGFATNRRIYTCYMTATDVRVVRLGRRRLDLTLTDAGRRSSPASSARRAAGTPAAAPGSDPFNDAPVRHHRRRRPRHQPAEPQRRSTARCCASRPTARRPQGNMEINGRRR